MNGQSNVDRLVAAGIIVETYLTPEGIEAINTADITDEEIEILQGIKQKLELEPLDLSGPTEKMVGIWKL
jgi:hypothetical protein